MRAVLFGFLGHQTNVGDIAHGCRVKLSVLFGVFQNFLIHGCVAAVRHHGDGILEFVVLIPHPAAVTHNVGHGGVDDDVVRDVQIGDAAAGIDHGQRRSLVIHCGNIGFDLGFFPGRQAVELGQHVGQAVVDVRPDFLERRGVLVECVPEIDGHTVAEHDGIGDFHHGRFEVQGQQHPVVPGRVHLLGIEGAQGLDVHD